MLFLRTYISIPGFLWLKEKTGDFASILYVVGFVCGEQFSLGTEEGAIWTGFVLNIVSAFVRRNFVKVVLASANLSTRRLV